MFKPFRLIFLVAIAFVAGVLYERYNASERCQAVGGAISDGICRPAS